MQLTPAVPNSVEVPVLNGKKNYFTGQFMTTGMELHAFPQHLKVCEFKVSLDYVLTEQLPNLRPAFFNDDLVAFDHCFHSIFSSLI